jgi:hypothetical protein
MGLDIRLPIGGLFATMGLLLVCYGAVSDRSLYQRSLGVNVNLEWGLVLLVFGLVMGVLGRHRMKMSRGSGDTKVPDRPARAGGH